MKEHIKIHENIADMVDNFVKDNNLASRSLGLHIRATDKKYKGSLERLMNKIERMFEKGVIDKLFLATDNEDIEEMFKNKFSSRLVIYSKHNPSNGKPLHIAGRESNNEKEKEQMALEAIMDMFILSRTEYLLYQLGSTFSEISAVYHKEKKKQIAWQVFKYLGHF